MSPGLVLIIIGVVWLLFDEKKKKWLKKNRQLNLYLVVLFFFCKTPPIMDIRIRDRKQNYILRKEKLLWTSRTQNQTQWKE